ncbi:hypothetical protein [Citrobacter enshiensis]|uniref:hypothetical protein n=1 Tax=Citrobacter enshiensis TaxID=2971264 RepID=UPI0023E87232|nr:hypothetical protein [Citrobacter enshiensis]WET41679.1 hypothetical protein P2W74_05470 [Citrobacter enshiensis]
MSKKKLKEITIGELYHLSYDAFEKHNKSRMTLRQIGRQFIDYTLGLNSFKIDFSQVRLNFINESGIQDVTEDENEFYKYIAKWYVGLEKEPRDMVLDLFYHASDDLQKIDSQLKLINAHLKGLEEKKKISGWLNGEERYDRNLYEYYRDKNQSAKDEILKFLAEDLEDYALLKCQHHYTLLPTLGFFTGPMPYSYSRGIMFSNLDSFDVEQMTVMSNKFLDLPLPQYTLINSLYKNDKEKFYEFAKGFISGEIEGLDCALDKIEGYFLTSHIIGKRRDVLSVIISHYKNEDYVSVVNMLPMQIEGIFHDICTELGIDESRLDISSINEKLRILKDSIHGFIYFEYYSFKFPVIRNIVAHGKLVEADIEQEAIMLMLDLLPVCDMAVSDEIPVFRKIKLLNKILCNDFESLMKYMSLYDIVIPDFYDLADDIQTAESKLSSDNFWTYLRNEVKKSEVKDINESNIVKFVKNLNGRKICKQRANEFLKDLPNVINEILADKAARKEIVKKFTDFVKKNPD